MTEEETACAANAETTKSATPENEGIETPVVIDNGGADDDTPTESKTQGNNNKEGSHDEHEPEEDLLELFGPAYARETQFWKGLLWSAIPQGCLMALIALAFFNFYTFLAKRTWLTDEYHHALSVVPAEGVLNELFGEFLNETKEEIHGGEERVLQDEEHAETDISAIDIFRLGNGEWWYVALLAGAGLAVGLTKVIWNLIVPAQYAFPHNIPGFIDDVRGLKSHNIWLPLPLLFSSALSIGLGGSCGPEQGMGAAGTALGHIISFRWRLGNHEAVPARRSYQYDSEVYHQQDQEEEEQPQEEQEKPSCLSKFLPDFSNDHMCAMDGIAAAFGALFPSQYLSPMIIMELGGHWGKGGRFAITETIARAGVAASIAYVIFTGLEDRTLLHQIELPIAAYSFLPQIKAIHMLEASILGIICGFIGCFGLLVMAVGAAMGEWTHQMFLKLGNLVGLKEERFNLGMLLTPVVGGALVGLLCVAAPLCLSDGADQLGAIIAQGKALGADTIAVTGLVKLGCVSICLGFGFVGGAIFPFVFTGTCVGVVANLWVTDIHILVAVTSCMVAVPCAFVPAIFTFTTLASVMLALGGAATSPVFAACICSYTTVCGMGVVQDALRTKKEKRHAEKAAGASESESA